jgi:glycosyltransferase involved in cell wall biosynthesis
VKRLKWLLLATHVPAGGTGGGIVRYTVEIADHLDRHPDVELHVLTVASTRDFFVELLGDAQRVRTLPNLPTPLLSVLETVGAGTHGGFDVIHGTKHVVPSWRRAQKVLTIHDMLLIDRPSDYSILKRVLLRPSYRRAIRTADSLVCVSRSTERRLAALLPPAAARSTAVPLAVSARLRESVPMALGPVDGVPFALVVGDTSPRKNVGLVVDCWHEVLEREPDARLVLVGPPSWTRDVVGREFTRLVESGRLVTPGHLSEEQLRWCYEHAVVVLCPSLAEGFGLPAAEAMCFGAPVITSQDAALCEVTGAAALHLAATDRDGWVAAIVAAFARPVRRDPPATSRTWCDVADETVRFVGDAR